MKRSGKAVEANPPRGPDPRPARVVVAPAAGFGEAGARLLAGALRTAAPRQGAGDGSVSLALAGGSTPRPVYERLAGAPVPWEVVDVFFGDERCVPPDDPESNYRMARKALLDRIPVPEDRVHRMACEAGDPDRAAERYARALPDRLDVLVLGIGSDGHTASLFPGAPALGESARRVAAVRAPEPPRRRLTLTPPVLRAARRTFVLAAGRAKAAAVRRALEGPWDPSACPAQLARGGVWILDSEAGASLRLPVEEAETP